MITRRSRRSWLSFGPALSVIFLSLIVPPVLSSHNQLSAKDSKDRDYALIFGTVWGPDDRPVYGVKVKIRRAKDKKAKWELYSDHHGEFAQRVPVGNADYVVWADTKGLKTAAGKPLQAQPVPVHIDYDERADIGLHLTQ